MRIPAHESVITGQWVEKDGKVVADENCARIHELTHAYLRELGHDPSGWDTLFQDPADNRLWERIYPHSSWHGAGPPELRVVSLDDARAKYGAAVAL